MNADELKAAIDVAEAWGVGGGLVKGDFSRILEAAKCHLARLAADDLGDSIDDAYKARIADLEARLATYERRAEKDAEPITEEWALANGAGRDDGGGVAWKIWERGQDESTEEPAFHVLWSLGSLWLECYSTSGDTLGLIELITPATRKGIKHLLAALGVKGGQQ